MPASLLWGIPRDTRGKRGCCSASILVDNLCLRPYHKGVTARRAEAQDLRHRRVPISAPMGEAEESGAYTVLDSRAVNRAAGGRS